MNPALNSPCLRWLPIHPLGAQAKALLRTAPKGFDTLEVENVTAPSPVKERARAKGSRGILGDLGT